MKERYQSNFNINKEYKWKRGNFASKKMQYRIYGWKI